LLCDHDSIKISQTIDELLENGISSSKLSSDSLDYLVQNIDKNSTLLTNMTGGYYYWAVFASDLDNHLRFAKIDGQRIAHFYIPYPDLVVDNISFEYYPYITEDDFQGVLKIHISNQGDKSATNVTTTLRDSIKTLEHRLNTLMDNEANNVPSLQIRKLSALDPGKKHVIEHQWHTPHLGLHEIKVHTRADENEFIKNNNSMIKDFYTIPKGKVSTADSATVFLISKVSIDMPIITEIAFDKNSSKVKSIYLKKSIFDPHLRILAERLMTHPELKITLQGFADPNSENSSVELAMERANAVKDSLSSFGVDQNQIIVLPGQVLKKRAVPGDPVDAKWIFEERRYVKIHADQQAQSVLFAPVRHTDREEIEKSLKFITDIKYSRQLVKDMIKLKGSVIQDSIDMNLDKQTESTQIVEWTPTFDAENENMNREIKFTVKIKDDLDRTFYSKPDKVLLGSREYQREHRIAFPLKFAETDPLYDFYWERLFNQVKEILETPDKKIKFTGHACKIGPEDVNQRLSERRAKRFHNDFLNYVQNNHPEYALQILDMIKLPEGFGESQPLAIVRLSGRQIIIGDNSKPMGRMLNRRIEIRLY
jgi:outer membrane protein OmpA-like peptidoglycan-associated protein